MDQAASRQTLGWYSPELLTEFLEELREAGYNIGLAQYIAAHDLILALFAKNILSQPEQLEEYLGPLLCNSATEQEEFKERFKKWIRLVNSRHSAAVENPSQSVQALDNELKKLGKKSRRLKFALLSCIFLFPPLLWAGFQFIPSDASLEEPAETAAPQTPVNPTTGEETPAQVVIEPKPTPWEWELLALLSLIVPVLSFIVWRAWWMWRARLFLRRRMSDQPPELAKISFKGQEELFNSQILLKASQQLRRRVRTNDNSLNVSKTIYESVRRGGWFTPIYSYRQAFPEYLFLIDRASVWDHQAKFAQTLVHRFQQNGVYVEVFFFDADPRVCFSQRRDRPPQTLQELSAKYQHYRPVIFADAEVFIDPQTAQLNRWSTTLLRWKNLFVITPKPVESWGGEEFGIVQSFILLPMTETGIKVLGQVMQEGSAVYTAQEVDPVTMPTMLKIRPKRWLERNPPTLEQAKELIIGLKDYLGEEGFYWLAACAVFPALRWNITLYLGNILTARDGCPLIERCSFLDLARLPWCRYGYMPNWFRKYLIVSLSRQRESEIRAAFQRLLVTATKGSVELSELEIAEKYQRVLPDLAQSLFRLISRRAPEQSIFREYIFLDFMFRSSRLALEVPEEVASTLGEHRQYLKRSLYLRVGIALLAFSLPIIYFLNEGNIQDPFSATICHLVNRDNLRIETILLYDTGEYIVRVFRRRCEPQILMNVFDNSQQILHLDAQPATLRTVSGQDAYVSSGAFDGRQVEFVSQVFDRPSDPAGGFARLLILQRQPEFGEETSVIRVEDAERVQIFNVPPGVGQGQAERDTILFFETQTYSVRVFNRGGQRLMNAFNRFSNVEEINGKVASLFNPVPPFENFISYVSSGVRNNQSVQYFARYDVCNSQAFLEIYNSNGNRILREDSVGALQENIPLNDISPSQQSCNEANGLERPNDNYVVAVCGGEDTLGEVQQLIPEAYLDNSSGQEQFISAGTFSTEEEAMTQVLNLQQEGFDARLGSQGEICLP